MNTMTMIPIKRPAASPLQENIYEAQKDLKRNIAILATAGSGKTTTIIGMLERAPHNRRSIFISFSNSIVKELVSRIPSRIPAKTIHSLGFAMIRDYFKGIRIQVNKEKYFLNALQIYKDAKGDPKAFLTKEEYRECRQIESVSAYARMTMTPFKEDNLVQMCAYYNLDFNQEVLRISLKLLGQAKIGRNKGFWIDFVDMIYLPAAIPAMIHDTYDDVYLDEAQDTNAAQRIIIEAIVDKKKGRLISVGDDQQCIYGFAGSTVDSFKLLRDRPNTTVLPLSVSYRCPRAVIRKIKEVGLGESIEAWENAIEGEARTGHWSEIREGNMILSRTTKPLVSLYFKLVQERVKATVIGKDIEEGLLALAEICQSKTKEGVIAKLNIELDKLVASLQAKGIRYPERTPQYESLQERYELIELILSKIDSSSKLVSTIEKIFHEDKEAARLMTVHRSKGLENNVVFLIEKIKGEPQMPSKRAKQEWERIQESNLIFVALSRSKQQLILLDIDYQEE